MSFLKDFNEYHFSIKTAVFCIAIYMPFWYLDTYLLARWYVDQTPMQLPIVISFCISIVWYIATLVALAGYQLAFESANADEKKESSDENDVDLGTIWHVLLSISSLAILSSWAYSNKWTLKTLIDKSFEYVIGATVLGFLFYFVVEIENRWIARRKAKKEIQCTEQTQDNPKP